MNIVYIDILFLINSFTTYILLAVTSHISGSFLKKSRHIRASLLSGLISIFVFFAPPGMILSLFLRLFLCVTIISSAFMPSRQELLRLSGIFFITSLCMGGLVFLASMSGLMASNLRSGVIYLDISMIKLISIFGVGILIFELILGKGGMIQKGQIVSVEAVIDAKRLSFSAMVDTGNLLTEPVTKKSVILLSNTLYEGHLPIENRRVYPVVAKSAGEGFTVINTYEPDELFIDGKRRDDFMIGIAKSQISGIQGTKAIIGGSVWH